jgi:NAD(P) transhydrogenase
VPEMSMIGATEEQLRAKGVAYEVGIARFRELARGQILGVDTGMLKLIVGIEDHKLLGVHILGEGATELIHVGQMVIGLGGTLDFLVDSVFNYPTLAEAYKVAALDAWNRMPKKAPKEMVEPLRAVP